MNIVDIHLQLRTMIARLAHIDADFRGDADVFRELGLESGAALDLLLQMEEEFDVSIADEDFGDARTLEQMTALVAGLRGLAA
jgi:acyl carrier protein